MGDNGPIRDVALHLIGAAQGNDVAHVFTLNYDALLDSALLHFYQDDDGRPRSESGFTLVDDAQGNRITQMLITGQTVRALGWREDPYGGVATVRLYHLHGAASWVRDRASGAVMKVRHLQHLRDHNLWGKWSAGQETHLEPVVVLGDRKDRLITRAPFDTQYAYLQAAAIQSEEIVIAGYGFGDAPLNAAVRASLSPTARVWVIDPDAGVEARAREALGMATGARIGQLTFIHAGLPDGLSAV